MTFIKVRINDIMDKVAQKMKIPCEEIKTS